MCTFTHAPSLWVIYATSRWLYVHSLVCITSLIPEFEYLPQLLGAVHTKIDLSSL